MSTNPETWGERIKWIAKRFCPPRGSLRQLGEEIGVSGQAVSAWARGQSEPTGAALASIIQRYPRINPQWLLTGLGPRERPLGEGDPATVAIADALSRIQRMADTLASDYGLPGPDEEPGTGEPTGSPPGEGPSASGRDALDRHLRRRQSPGGTGTDG